MSPPEVSVVIPCFNRETMIAECIRSALAQGGSTEVIVIDDGSTDRSWEIISSFKEIVARKISNSGVSAARNRGIELARGSYIKFLDSDDLLPKGSIRDLLVVRPQLEPGQIAVGTAVVDGSTNKPMEYGFGHALQGGVIPIHLLLRHPMPCGLPLFPIECLREAGGFDETLTISEDYVLAVKLQVLGYRFVQYQIPAYIVRDHDGPRLSRRYSKVGFEAQHRAFQAALSELGEIGTEERRSIGRAAWVLGREASRQGYPQQANALFALAQDLGGPEARVGTAHLRLLYRILPPYLAERIAMLAKRANRRLA